MYTGTVIWYNPIKGIGFVKPDKAGADVFIHMKALKESGLKQVTTDDRLTYKIANDKITGRQAATDITRLTPAEANILKSPLNKKVKPKQPPAPPPIDIKNNKFYELGLDPIIVKNLYKFKYQHPTPIQEQAIPLILKGRDIIGLAQTGTGKTAAFCLPILHKLLLNPITPKSRSTRALILSPTRELALQIYETVSDISKHLPLKSVTAIGGASLSKQIRNLKNGTDIIIATPGRLEDLIAQRALRLDQTEFLILDEADQMLDIGFLPAIKRITAQLSPQRQNLLFSATFSNKIKTLTNSLLTDPVHISVTPENTAVENIEQSLMYVTKQKKDLALEHIIKNNPRKRIIVFTRTKHISDKIVKWLATQDICAKAIHSNKSQGQRIRALEEFKAGKIFVLIATDIAARGIDISQVEIVINYDLPNVTESYIHRIGRTARAGNKGRAIAFCAPDEVNLLFAIESLIKTQLPVKRIDNITMPDKPERQIAPKRPRPKSRHKYSKRTKG